MAGTVAELSCVENLVTRAGRGRAPWLVPGRPDTPGWGSPVSPGPRITVMGHVSGPRSQEPGAETNVLLAMATLLAPAEVTLGHLSSCNDGDPTSKNKYISQQLK